MQAVSHHQHGKLIFAFELRKPRALALAHWTPVHVHLGASETLGRVAILKGGEIDPGGDGLAQLVLDNPIGAINGDRLILRDQSGQRTIGGGKVIDINLRRGAAASLNALPF